MRDLLNWFNGRRRLVALALLGLVVVVSLSAGATPEEGEWVRVPDLGFLGVVLLGLTVVLGITFIALVRPKAGARSGGERRSIRALLIMALLVAAATELLGPEDADEETTPPPEQESIELVEETPVEAPPSAFLEASGTDIAAFLLILLVVGFMVARVLQTEPDPPELDLPTPDLPEELAPAVEQAHEHLTEETDPRLAVLQAYAALETALAELDRKRQLAETPSEHMARVLADLPELATPAVRLGELYEIARFSRHAVTEEDRAEATRSLSRARDSLSALSLPTA